MVAGFERGRALLRRQDYRVLDAFAAGDRVALEVAWTGGWRNPWPTFRRGDELRAQFGIFLQLRDGRIVRQRNYHCHDPF